MDDLFNNIHPSDALKKFIENIKFDGLHEETTLDIVRAIPENYRQNEALIEALYFSRETAQKNYNMSKTTSRERGLSRIHMALNLCSINEKLNEEFIYP